jgi:hypothetical protein
MRDPEDSEATTRRLGGRRELQLVAVGVAARIGPPRPRRDADSRARIRRLPRSIYRVGTVTPRQEVALVTISSAPKKVLAQ